MCKSGFVNIWISNILSNLTLICCWYHFLAFVVLFEYKIDCCWYNLVSLSVFWGFFQRCTLQKETLVKSNLIQFFLIKKWQPLETVFSMKHCKRLIKMLLPTFFPPFFQFFPAHTFLAPYNWKLRNTLVFRYNLPKMIP